MKFSPVFHDPHYLYLPESLEYIKNKKYDKEIHIFSNKPDLSYVHKYRNKNTIFVLDISREPEIFRISNKEVINNKLFFDIILTWDNEILDKCSNAFKFLYGTSWISKSGVSQIIDKKTNSVSFICGSKNITEGHKIRQELWRRQKEFNNKNILKDFFISSNKPIDSVDNNKMLPTGWIDQKYVAFFSKFHISIENVSTMNYFSEKIIDCFVTKTVPVYLGCKNIGDFFELKGIIVCNNSDEIIKKINTFDDKLYNDMQFYVDRNYELSQYYNRDIT
jgi:hypothetical protein